jgi:tetratricopeptide (TPR) repeat protein
MNKENVLFTAVGLLAGLIIGFMGANYLNKNAVPPGAVTANQLGLPQDHPQVPGQPGQPGAASMQDVQSAIEAANKDPNDFNAQVRAGELHYQIQRFDDAIKYYTQANKIKPDDYAVIVNLGNANFDASKFEEAEKWYGKALEMKPDDVSVRTDMGLTYIFRQPPDYDKAVTEFNRSLEIDPKHPQTLQNLVVAYTKKGDAQNATATLTRLEQADPGNQAIPKLKEEIGKAGQTSSPQAQ